MTKTETIIITIETRTKICPFNTKYENNENVIIRIKNENMLFNRSMTNNENVIITINSRTKILLFYSKCDKI